MKKKDAKILPKMSPKDNSLKIKNLSKTNNNCISNNTNLVSNNKKLSIKFSSIISNNLKHYSITKKKYNIYIINSIIFDQKNHIVTEFKNYLLWDETSEFLKRFYYLAESFERLPNISQYYETYTLFSPIYFGLDSPLIIIMNEWTKRKKKYLEYIEEKEEEDEKKKNNKNYEENLNFKKIIKSNLISESSDIKSKNSSKTIDLTKYDNIDSFFLKENNNLTSNEKEKEQNNNNNINNDISLSKIMNDLSSNYSVYINNIKKNEENETKNNFKKQKKEKDNKKEINTKDKNINAYDNIFSLINLYKNRNKNIHNKSKNKKNYYASTYNSNSKIKKKPLNDKFKDKIKEINKKNNIINLPVTETKNNNNTFKKNRLNTHKKSLQITLNNFTRNKTSLKEKKEKEKNKKQTLTNTHINTNTNINSFNNSANNSLTKCNIRKQKLKKLYLRNLITQSNYYIIQKDKSQISNTIDLNNNNDTTYSIKKNNCVFSKLLNFNNEKNKKSLLNRNLINLKNFNSYRTNKNTPSNTQISFEPFTYKINKIIKKKRIVTTSTNSFSNNINSNKNNNNNSNNINDYNKKINNYILLNKKLSNGNLIRNLVLNQFYSKKEIVPKSKNNFIYNNTNNYFNSNNTHHKVISSLSKNISYKNSSLLKSKKYYLSGKSNTKLNESANNKYYKKHLNKINLNFNFNINFNIGINKRRKYLPIHKNSLGLRTQRSPMIKLNNLSKSNNKGTEKSKKKNVLNSLIKNMKKDYNLRIKKNN